MQWLRAPTSCVRDSWKHLFIRKTKSICSRAYNNCCRQFVLSLLSQGPTLGITYDNEHYKTTDCHNWQVVVPFLISSITCIFFTHTLLWNIHKLLGKTKTYNLFPENAPSNDHKTYKKLQFRWIQSAFNCQSNLINKAVPPTTLKTWIGNCIISYQTTFFPF